MARKQRNQRSDKRFQTSLQVGTVGKKRLRKYFYGVSKEEAEQKKLEYMRTHPADTAVNDRDITLGKWMDRWLDDYKSGVTDNTRAMYKSSVTFIKKFIYDEQKISDMKMTDIKPKHINALAGSMKGLSKSYIRQVRQTTNQIFDAAVENHIIGESPVVKISYPKGTYEGHRDLQEYEKELVLKYWRVHRAGRWAMLMMYGGLRREEMAALNWEDVDLDNAKMNIVNAEDLQHKKTKETKTEKSTRTVPIFRPLLEMLKEIGPGKGLICVAKNGNKLTESSFKQAWTSYLLTLERALNGVKPEFEHGWRRDRQVEKFKKDKKEYRSLEFSAHDLRVTYCTMLYDMGIDVKTAALWMGHENIETTMKIYTKLSERKKNMAMDRANEFFQRHDY